jgi:hypothetical protein
MILRIEPGDREVDFTILQIDPGDREVDFTILQIDPAHLTFQLHDRPETPRIRPTALLKPRARGSEVLRTLLCPR